MGLLIANPLAGEGCPLSAFVVFALLLGAIVISLSIGYCAGWLHTRTRARGAALGQLSYAVRILTGHLNDLKAHVDRQDMRQDRRLEYLINRAVGLIDTVQVPALRLVGASGDPASVSLPAQANRDKRERESNVTPIGPHVDELDQRLRDFTAGAFSDLEDPGDFPA